MWKKNLTFLFLTMIPLIFLSSNVGAVEKFCSQTSPFGGLCTEQLRVDKYVPCRLLAYDTVYCPEIYAGDWDLLKVEQSKVDAYNSALAVNGLMPTSLKDMSKAVTKEDEVKECTNVLDEKTCTTKVVNITINPTYFLDFTKSNTLTVQVYAGKSFSIGFGTNNFTTTSFINGSVDEDLWINPATSYVEMQEVNYTSNASGLVGWWKLNEGTGTVATDLSGNGYNGALENFSCTTLDCSATSGWNSQGRRSKAVLFDGTNDEIRIPSGTIPSGNWSFCAWVNSTGQGPNFANSVFRMDGGWNIFFGGSNVAYQNHWGVEGTSNKYGNTAVGANNLNHWVHICVTANTDGTVYTFYYNGTFDGTGVMAIQPISQQSAIGSRLGGYFFKGKIDEVQLWNRVLSLEEVNASYNAGIYLYGGNTSRAGTYTGELVNATNTVTFNNITITADNRTAVSIQTRTGSGGVWNSWRTCSFTKTNFCTISGDWQAQYLEYKVTLSTDNNTYTPILSNVTIDWNNCIENWFYTGWWENTTHKTYNLTDSNNCGTTYLKPNEVESKMASWETAIVILYVAALSLYVVYGFTLKDKQIKQKLVNNQFVKYEIVEPFLTGLKYLYLLTAPVLVLLGIHLATKMAEAAGATTSITNALGTSYKLLSAVYILTLGVFFIIMLKNVIGVLASGVSGFSRYKKRKEQYMNRK